MDGNRIKWKSIRLLEITKWKFHSEVKSDDGLDCDKDGVRNTLPSHLGAFTLSNSKRIMNIFLGEINGFYNNSIYYGDTDGM